MIGGLVSVCVCVCLSVCVQDRQNKDFSGVFNCTEKNTNTYLLATSTTVRVDRYRMPPFWVLLKLRMMDMVVVTHTHHTHTPHTHRFNGHFSR